jgi:hypothetical protein
MKNAYQRRRVKARVEKRARMNRLDAITLDFARQVIEEETGTPLEITGRAPEVPETAAAGEARLVARDDKKNPLISTFAWTDDATQRILRVPAGFMRNKTQERIEELARERAATTIDLVLVEDGIEIGKRMMAEMISTYQAPGKSTGTTPISADQPATASGAPAESSGAVRNAAGAEWLRVSLNVRGEPGGIAKSRSKDARSAQCRHAAARRHRLLDTESLLGATLRRPPVTAALFKRRLVTARELHGRNAVRSIGSPIVSARPEPIHKIPFIPIIGDRAMPSSARLARLEAGDSRTTTNRPVETFACGALFGATGMSRKGPDRLRLAIREYAAAGRVNPITVDVSPPMVSLKGIIRRLLDARTKKGRHRRAWHRLRRANRSLPSLCEARSGGRDRVAPFFCRGWWSAPETTALSNRHGKLPVPEGPSGRDLERVLCDSRFPSRRRASALRSGPSTALRVALSTSKGEGAVRLGPPFDQGIILCTQA